METKMKNLICELATKIPTEDGVTINLLDMLERHGLKKDDNNLRFVLQHIKILENNIGTFKK